MALNQIWNPNILNPFLILFLNNYIFEIRPIWRFPEIKVPPNHPLIDGFSLINHPFWVTPFMEPPTIWIQHDPTYPRLSPPGCGWDRWSCTWAIASAHRRWQGRLATPRSLPSRGVGSWAWHQSGAWKTGVHNKNWLVSRVYLHFGDGFPGFPWNKKKISMFFIYIYIYIYVYIYIIFSMWRL